jgi:indolepyruvate ferredoxin oxidoreductase
MLERSAAASTVKLQRTPYFCSGCPHNSSTKIPEGSRAMAGIGCHSMALYIPSRRTTTPRADSRDTFARTRL